jgi:hypothetical protein
MSILERFSGFSRQRVRGAGIAVTMRVSSASRGAGFAVLLLLLGVGACADDVRFGTPPLGGLVVLVKLDGQPAEGVPVEFTKAGAGTATAVTASNGAAVMHELSAGSYEIRVTVPEGARLVSGQTNPTRVRLGTGEYKVHRVAFVHDL